MRCHDVYLLCYVVKIDSFGALVAAGTGLIVLVYMIRGALLGVLFKELTLL